jgi:hypothetical protein
MKKILVTLLVVSSMIFAMAIATMASDVYVDGLVSGDLESKTTYALLPTENSDDKYDLNGYTVGTNLNFGRFLINLDYSKDTIKAIEAGESDEDQNTINIKCGYILIGDEQSYLALTAGYHQTEPDENTDDEKMNGAIIGLNAASNLGERSRLEGFVGYSVDGSMEFLDDDSGSTVKYDLDILLLQVKYSYYLTDNFGIGIGYKSIRYKIDEELFVSKITHSGPTIGLTYRF